MVPCEGLRLWPGSRPLASCRVSLALPCTSTCLYHLYLLPPFRSHSNTSHARATASTRSSWPLTASRNSRPRLSPARSTTPLCPPGRPIFSLTQPPFPPRLLQLRSPLLDGSSSVDLQHTRRITPVPHRPRSLKLSTSRSRSDQPPALSFGLSPPPLPLQTLQ